MDDNLIKTPCALICFNLKNSQIEKLKNIKAEQIVTVLGLEYQGIVFPLSVENCSILIESVSETPQLQKIPLYGLMQYERIAFAKEIGETIQILSHYCEVSKIMAHKPILLWNE